MAVFLAIQISSRFSTVSYE